MSGLVSESVDWSKTSYQRARRGSAKVSNQAGCFDNAVCCFCGDEKSAISKLGKILASFLQGQLGEQYEVKDVSGEINRRSCSRI